MSKKLCSRKYTTDIVKDENVNRSNSNRSCDYVDPESEKEHHEQNRMTSLMDICITYIAKHVHYVESFFGFPDIIGEKIFKTALTVGTFTNENTKLSVSLKAFCDAYGVTVLENLCLTGQYLVLNNYLDTIILFTDLIKLDISSCGLGDSHEILYHISQLHSLETLNLRENALSDGGIQRLTVPIRMFHKGPKTLKYLDLSENQLTEKGMKNLLCFSHLELVNVTGNNLKNYSILKAHGLHLSTTAGDLCREVFSVETKGWAAPVISLWCQKQKNKAQSKKARKSTFYGKAQDPVSHPSPTVQTPQIYSHVLVSHQRLSHLVQDDSNIINKVQCSRRPSESTKKCRDSVSENSKFVNATHGSTDMKVKSDESRSKMKGKSECDVDLLELYSGYAKPSVKTPTLSSVLTDSW